MYLVFAHYYWHYSADIGDVDVSVGGGGWQNIARYQTTTYGLTTIDITAYAAGQSDVFAHGMLVMAYLGRGVTSWVPQSALRRFFTQFKAITRVGEKITVTGKVAKKEEVDGEKQVSLELAAKNDSGDAKAVGEAVVALS